MFFWITCCSGCSFDTLSFYLSTVFFKGNAEIHKMMYLTLFLLFIHLTCKIYLRTSYHTHIFLFYFSPLGLRLHIQTCKQNVKIIKYSIISNMLFSNGQCCFPKPLQNAFFRSLERLSQYKLDCNKHSCLSMTASFKEILVRLDRNSPQLWRVVYWFRNLGHEKMQESHTITKW